MRTLPVASVGGASATEAQAHLGGTSGAPRGHLEGTEGAGGHFDGLHRWLDGLRARQGRHTTVYIGSAPLCTLLATLTLHVDSALLCTLVDAPLDGLPAAFYKGQRVEAHYGVDAEEKWFPVFCEGLEPLPFL